MKRKLLFAVFLFSVFNISTIYAQSVVVAGISASYVYTGSPIAPTPVVRDGMRTLKKDVDYILEYKNNVNVGAASVIIKYIGNYMGEDKKEFNITKARLVATIDAGQSKVYGTADPKLTYKITSGELKGNDVMKGSLERQAGEDVGIYPIIQGTLTAGDNYELFVTKNNFKIDRAVITVKPNSGQKKIYGQPTPEIKYTIVEGALVGKDAFAGALGLAMGENVGTYPITIGTLTAGKNYDLRLVPDQSFEILKTDIAVKPDVGQSKIFGAPEPAISYSITSGALVNNDAFKGNLTRQPGEDVGTYTIKKGTLNLSNNYNLKVDTLQKFEIKRKLVESSGTPVAATATPAAN